MNFPLNPLEKNICSFLLEVNNRMRTGSILRIAGGFVRDKLLGIPSDDIDIAVSNMTGKQFVEKATQYGDEWQKQNGQPHPALGKSYVVEANPEKSKQLETTALQIYGLKVDFVNLREEKYDPESRVPVMTLATGPDAPKKDAERRDLSINALFYNINTGQIEDYVGGLEDLQSMTLRTPLEPVQTFKDDPLRLLRVLRFYSKYPNARIDPKIIEAMKLPEVHNMYADLSAAFDPKKKNYKVSPERAWPELKKIMSGARPAEALRIMFNTGLYKAVFNTHKFRELMDINMDQKTSHHAHNLIDHTLNVMEEMNKIVRAENIDPETRMLMNFATLFHDMGKAHPEIRKPHKNRPGEYSYHQHEEKSVEVADEILKIIGMGDKARSFVTQIISGHMDPHLWNEPSSPIAGIPTGSDSRKIRSYYSQLHQLLSKITPIEKSNKKDALPTKSYSRGDIANLIMLHSLADTIGKNVKEPDVKDMEAKKRHRVNLQNYYGYWQGLKPLIDGFELIKMFSHLDPAYAVDGKTFINDLKERLSEKQATGFIVSKEDALKFVDQMRPYINDQYNKEKQQKKDVTAWLVSQCRFSKL